MASFRATAICLTTGAGLLSWGTVLTTAALPAQAGVGGTTRAPRSAPGWIGTWQMAPTGATRPGCRRCTIRDVVHTSIGGSLVRVRLSNDFGVGPLRVEHTTVALPRLAGRPDVLPGSLRTVTFGGARSVVVPAHSHVFSDPTPLEVGPAADLFVTTYTPDSVPLTYHPSAQQYSFLSDGPDNTEVTDGGALSGRTVSWWVTTGVDVQGRGERGALVAFGDSITDGAGSTTGRDARWPDELTRRFASLPVDQRLSVLNAGIGGNRLLRDGGLSYGPSGLNRFGADVLDQSGVRAVILLLGINDIMQRPAELDAARITAGLSRLADRAHDQGLVVLAGTLTPFEGWHDHTAAGERTRQAVNQWIRGTRDLDGYVDFDAALRDPARPLRLQARYDSGDHLHPGDAGYLRMAAAVNLAELWPRGPQDPSLFDDDDDDD